MAESQVSGLIEQVQLGATAHSIASTAYGICDSPASTPGKEVNMTGFDLKPGVTVHIKFINENTAESPTLSIAGSIAKPLAITDWASNSILSLTYDNISDTWVYNTSGKVPFESLPTGTSGSTVAIGDHTHGLGNLTTVALSSKSNLDKHHATAIIRSSSSQLFFGGSGNGNKVDFIGLQLRGSNDEFQLVSETQLAADRNTLLFRQNDNASPNANNWGTWQQLVHTNYINRVGGAGNSGSKEEGSETVATPVYIATNGTATPIAYTIGSDVPIGAVFTDTNQYHKTGSWNGLTYTADAVNGADELAFTIPDNYGDTKNPYASKTKNYVLAAPSDANGAPSFRALVAADILDLSSTYLKLDGSNNMNDDVNIIVGEYDKFVNFWYDTNKKAGASWRLGMLGTGLEDANYFVIQSGTSTLSNTNWTNALRIGMNTHDINVSSTTASTTTSTGALTVSGGLGVAGQVTAETLKSGNITIGGTIDTNAGKTISCNSTLYINHGAGTSIIFSENNVDKMCIDTSNAFRPETTNTLSIGTSDKKWANVYATIFDGTTTSLTHIANASDGLKIKYNTTIDFFIGVGTGNINHGLYDNKASGGAKWILYAGSGNVWYFAGDVIGNVSGSSGSCTGNAATATTATYLGNIGRQTNMNIDFGTTYNSKVFISYADGSTTTNKPPSNAIVFNVAWDNINNSHYGAQMALSNTTAPHIFLRGCNNGTWDTTWITVLDSSNYTTYAVEKTAGVTAVTWDATNKKLTRTINGTAADVMTAAQMSAALELGTIASKATTDYLSVKYSNLDYTSTVTSMGVYPINNQIHPVTGKAEYGGAIQFGSISTSNNYYAAQLLISSESGGTSTVHAYIRRMTSAPGWSNWTTLLDSSNYTDYTVTQTGAGASGDWNINAATATTATNLSTAPTIIQTGSSGTVLSAATFYTLTVGGQTVVFKTPSDINDKVTQNIKTDDKKYGIILSNYETNSSVTTEAEVNRDSKVYVNPSLNSVNAGQFVLHDKAATPVEKAYMVWNATDQSIDFVFN